MRIIALLALGLLPACTTIASDKPVTAGNSGGKCAAQPVQSHIGQTATAQLGAELLAKSGARTLRWGAPNTAMTMDYREDRLNVMYDANMVIERINCG